MNVKAKLAQMGVMLPDTPRPVAAYVPAVQAGDLVFVSGQLPFQEGKLSFRGRVGMEVSLETAQEAARIAAVNCLAAVEGLVGLENLVRIVKLTGFVASSPGFTDQPLVINGASEFLLDVFGSAGMHARAAVGVTALPLNSPVEIEMVVQVK